MAEGETFKVDEPIKGAEMRVTPSNDIKRNQGKFLDEGMSEKLE